MNQRELNLLTYVHAAEPAYTVQQAPARLTNDCTTFYTRAPRARVRALYQLNRMPPYLPSF